MPDLFSERIERLLRPGAFGPPLSEDDVKRAESALQVTLPADLVTLLRFQNGGYVADEFAACPTTRPTSWADDHVEVNEIAGIGDGGLSLLDSPVLNREWGQPQELVLLSGDGHRWVALDYRTCGPAGEPAVVFHENESEGSPDDLRLADSFRAFVCRLGPGRTIDVTLKPGQVKSVWIDPELAREHGLDRRDDTNG